MLKPNSKYICLSKVGREKKIIQGHAMSAILKKHVKTCTRITFRYQCLKVLRLRTHIQFITSSVFPENVQLKIASIYLDSLCLILTF